jgi:hypothetical protein
VTQTNQTRTQHKKLREKKQINMEFLDVTVIGVAAGVSALTGLLYWMFSPRRADALAHEVLVELDDQMTPKQRAMAKKCDEIAHCQHCSHFVPDLAKAWAPSYPPRIVVAMDNVPWTVDFAQYNPSAAGEQVSAGHAVQLYPKGRTGITGRGIFPRFGANYMHMYIFTFLSEDSSRAMHALQSLVSIDIWSPAVANTDSGAGVGEMGATTGKQWGLVCMGVDRCDASTDFPLVLRESMGLARIDLKDKSTVLYSGLIDDPRNTDHAWIEGVVIQFKLTLQEALQMNIVSGEKCGRWVCALSDDVHFPKHVYSYLALAHMNYRD